MLGLLIARFQIDEHLSYQISIFNIHHEKSEKAFNELWFHCCNDSSNAKCVEYWNDNNRSLKCEIKCVDTDLWQRWDDEKQCISIDSFGCLEFQSKWKTDTMWWSNVLFSDCQLVLKLSTYISLYSFRSPEMTRTPWIFHSPHCIYSHEWWMEYHVRKQPDDKGWIFSIHPFILYYCFQTNPSSTVHRGYGYKMRNAKKIILYALIDVI